MNDAVDKDLLIDVLLKENQHLKKFKAEYIEYKEDHKLIQASATKMSKVYDELIKVQEDKIQLSDRLIKVQNNEILELKARIKDLEEEKLNLLTKDVIEP